MATLRVRRRPQILVQLGDDFHPAWILNVADGRLLVDAGVEVGPGTRVDLHLDRPDGHSVDLIAAESVHCTQDVMAPASAEYRYLIVLRVDEPLGATARAALAAASVETPLPWWPWRRRAPTHDADLVLAALGAPHDL